MDERLALPLLAVGGILLVIGLLWLIVVACRTGFIKKALLPILFIILGVAAAGFIPVYNRIYPPPVQTTAQEEKKTTSTGEAEERLTLTGAKREEYAKLQGKKFAVVQWANPDVTDDDTAVLEGMADLREVDLSNSQVTDATLERLVKLPKLTKLYASRTKITADGVKKHILENPDSNLTEIDFRGLTPPVPGKALRDWQGKGPNRKFNN